MPDTVAWGVVPKSALRRAVDARDNASRITHRGPGTPAPVSIADQLSGRTGNPGSGGMVGQIRTWVVVMP